MPVSVTSQQGEIASTKTPFHTLATDSEEQRRDCRDLVFRTPHETKQLLEQRQGLRETLRTREAST